MKSVNLEDYINTKLDELVEYRVSQGNLIKTKQAVIADLVIKEHDKVKRLKERDGK